MATVFWTGLQQTKRKRIILTVGYAASQTYTVTANGKTFAFTATAAETTAAQIAAALVTVAGNAKESNITELTYSSSGASFFIDGPADGADFTASGAATGAGTFATASTVAGTSPNDWDDDANFDAPPEDGDTIVIPKGTPDIRHNLDGRTDKFGCHITREFGGPRIGLPDYKANGQAEWRPKYLEMSEPGTVRLNVSETTAQSIRIKALGDTNKLFITGAAQSAIGAEVVEYIGINAMPVYVNGCSLATGTVSGVSDTPTIYATNSTIRVGEYAACQGFSLTGGTAQINSSWTNNLTIDGGAEVAVMGAASGRPIIESGTLVWHSSGDIVSPVIGSDGFLDFDGGTGAVAVSGVNQSVILSSSAAATGGTASFRVPTPSGSYLTTGLVTWNTTDATLIANIQAAIDTVTGTTNGIVVSAIAPDTSLTFTYSGADYKGKEWPTVQAVTWFTSWSSVSSTSGAGTARPYVITRKADNARLRDTAKRITRPFTIVNDRCTMDGDTVQIGNHNELRVQTATLAG